MTIKNKLRAGIGFLFVPISTLSYLTLPQALNVFVMARQYDAWVSEASSSVLLGTLLSVVTLTAVMWMVKVHALPLHLFH